MLPFRKQTSFIFLVVFALAASSLACSLDDLGQSTRSSGIIEGSPAPDFALSSLQGEEVKLSDLQGRTVLLNFWTTWCGFCKQEMPDLEAAHQLYSGQGLTILLVNVEESGDEVQSYMVQNQLTMPVLLDEDGKVSRQYSVTGFPTSILIDPQGVTKKVVVGRMQADALDELVRTQLGIAEPAVTDQQAPVGQSVSSQVAVPTVRASMPAAIPLEVGQLRGCVTADNLNVRIGPGKQYSLVTGGMYRGDCVVFDGRSADATWARLSAEYLNKDGSRRWVSAKWIDFEGDVNTLAVIP